MAQQTEVPQGLFEAHTGFFAMLIDGNPRPHRHRAHRIIHIIGAIGTMDDRLIDRHPTVVSVLRQQFADRFDGFSLDFNATFQPCHDLGLPARTLRTIFEGYTQIAQAVAHQIGQLVLLRFAQFGA